MSDVMRVQPFATQLRRILAELDAKDSIFDIPRALFYEPPPSARYEVPALFGKRLGTPIGPSAGPQTQLSQNIVSAWLCGGRFIELKTVQARDDLAIPRPCIDATDEGYNVEWSQELRLDDSLHEYVVAWALLHLLPRILGRERSGAAESQRRPGVIFDMSVGYNLEGIQGDRMVRFMDGLADASPYLAPIRATLARDFPELADIEIPSQIANSVTLSTMHGCPPDEIERIARYLLETRHLHTVIKLNPTLLGKETVLEILHGSLGFHEIDIPDAVFEHDLRYERAIELIDALDRAAAAHGLTFGVKLSNTLAMRNHAGRLPGDEMYMSGRALYPVTMALYERLAGEFGGELHVSYSGGADAENVATVLSCGALPVTGCTDLLKPGGYGRLRQWLDRLDAAMTASEASSLAEWSRDRLANLHSAAAEALTSPRYKNGAFPHGLPKVSSALPFWDCVVAPCAAACAVEQDVPDYAWLIAEGRYDEALQVILARNPLPGVTGYVCTHLCQARCTRNDYEESVAIRALKRAAEERGRLDRDFAMPPREEAAGPSHRVAIVGAGPSGLAAAAFLALQGVKTTIFEARDVAGGMMRLVPPFRLPIEIIDRDIARIMGLGVELRLETRVEGPPELLLREGFDAVYVATGFQRDAPLRIPGAEGPGVVPALHLLDLSRRGQRMDLGRRAVVIGGGDTAMDAVRTAQRMTGQPVTILYRRTRAEMPAAGEEIEGALEEGNLLRELVSPLEVIREAGRVTGVRCIQNRLGEVGRDGRRSPQPIAGSEFTVPCDSVVVAVGQLPELSFLDGSGVSRHAGGGVVVDASRCAGPTGIYAGGDVVVEPGTIISACADGRKAAEAICARFGIAFAESPRVRPIPTDADIVAVKQTRTRRVAARQPAVLPLSDRSGFTLLESTLTDADARAEALRCVQCAAFCDKCVEVCPNRANYTFRIDAVAWRLPVLTWSASRVVVSGEEPFVVRQDRQILHVDDFCNECDNCQTFCVHHGRPYADKPRLFLDPDAFARERDNAFLVDGATLVRRDDGLESRLLVEEGALVYEDQDLQVTLTPEWQVLDAVARRPFEGTRSLRRAAECYVLYTGIRRSLAFLVVRRTRA